MVAPFRHCGLLGSRRIIAVTADGCGCPLPRRTHQTISTLCIMPMSSWVSVAMHYGLPAKSRNRVRNVTDVGLVGEPLGASPIVSAQFRRRAAGPHPPARDTRGAGGVRDLLLFDYRAGAPYDGGSNRGRAWIRSQPSRGAQLSHNAKRPLGRLLEMFRPERDIGEHAIDIERRHRAYPQ